MKLDMKLANSAKKCFTFCFIFSEKDTFLQKLDIFQTSFKDICLKMKDKMNTPIDARSIIQLRQVLTLYNIYMGRQVEM